MSYSLIVPCGDCTKNGKCVDRHFLEGAVSGIHSVWPSEKGHLGAGNIHMVCINYVKREPVLKGEG